MFRTEVEDLLLREMVEDDHYDTYCDDDLFDELAPDPEMSLFDNTIEDCYDGIDDYDLMDDYCEPDFEIG